MKIDTRYVADGMAVTIELMTDDELALGDDLIARIACNQHKLLWSSASGFAALGARDPSTFRFPGGYDKWRISRSGPRVTVTFKVPP